MTNFEQCLMEKDRICIAWKGAEADLYPWPKPTKARSCWVLVGFCPVEKGYNIHFSHPLQDRAMCCVQYHLDFRVFSVQRMKSDMKIPDSLWSHCSHCWKANNHTWVPLTCSENVFTLQRASELVWSGVTCRKRLLLPFRRRDNEKASFH